MIYILFMGFLVSFLGQLPLGNMSFTATQVCIQEGHRKAWEFALGVAIVEMLYLRFALTGMDWIVRHRNWFLALGWLTVGLFLVLGVMAFATARNQHPEKKALLLKTKMHRFLLGLVMSALNPVQIPFWFLWTSTFPEKSYHRRYHQQKWRAQRKLFIGKPGYAGSNVWTYQLLSVLRPHRQYH